MADPWLVIVGLGEAGLSGLARTSLDALARADVIFGGPRHLDLVGAGAKGQAWPVPFDLAPVLARRGQPTVILASGDPFWHGVGGSIAPHLAPSEWVSFPAPSTPSLAANRLGWRLEEVHSFGLHAAPFARLLPHLHTGAHLLATLRDGPAAAELAAWLTEQGCGPSTLHICEALGGPRERIRSQRADAFSLPDVQAPVLAAIEVATTDGLRSGLSRAGGLPDDSFAHDGQITKQPIRALTLSALSPRAGEHLWDLGAGSGSISVEWCLAGGTATAVEAKPDRAANICSNINRFGLTGRLSLIEGKAPDHLPSSRPDAIFVGGGMSEALFSQLALYRGSRLVVNSVTLETEALLTHLHAHHGGSLLRIDIATATPLGSMRGWSAARPVVQWSVTL